MFFPRISWDFREKTGENTSKTLRFASLEPCEAGGQGHKGVLQRHGGVQNFVAAYPQAWMAPASYGALGLRLGAQEARRGGAKTPLSTPCSSPFP